jgi:hypothetical protein
VYDLRRTAARNLEGAGVPRSVATEVTGHETERGYRRYAISNDADIRAGLAKLDAHMNPSQTAAPSAEDASETTRGPQGDPNAFRPAVIHELKLVSLYPATCQDRDSNPDSLAGKGF